MVLTPGTISFSDTTGNSTTVTQTITITRGDTATAPLTGLVLGTTTYVGPTGWLDASLSGPDAPATLTLSARKGTLAAGAYSAAIQIASPVATNSPQYVTVNLTLSAPPPPPAPPGPTVTVVAVGNLGGCGGEMGRESANTVAAANPDYVLMLGNSALDSTPGQVTTLDDYMNCYDPSWGQFKSKTYAALGTHEVDIDTVPPDYGSGMAPGADAYFGADRIGPPGRNYYSFNLGSWHVIALNTQSPGGYKRPIDIRFHAGSDQFNWLWKDLSNNSSKKCTLAFWYQAMWISSKNMEDPGNDHYPNHGYRVQDIRGIWTVLYEKNADLVINGTPHIYERFAPMRYDRSYQDPSPSEYAADSVRGIRQITAGLGGDGPNTFDQPAAVRHPLSVYRAGGNGVLKLVLGDGAYTWEFLNTKYSHISDRGYGTCH